MSQTLLQTDDLSARALCRALALPRASFQRWWQRQQQGEPPLRPPGPTKLGPLPWTQLQQELEALIHHPRRMRGTGALYERLREGVSRRGLQRLVNARRHQLNRAERRSGLQIRWFCPDLAWAIDATEYPRDSQGHKLLHVVVQDLATSYRFEPWLGLALDGQQTVAYLRSLLTRHGPPLFLKRDNGGVFNTPEIDALLAELGILPLNSPVRVPRYNGAVEHGIGELKSSLAPALGSPAAWDPAAALPLARAVVLHQNCAPRRRLAGQSSAMAYLQRPRLRWNRRERHDIFEWIGAHAKRILRAMDQPRLHDMRRAWRGSVEAWLRRQGLIEVSINGKPVTPFSPQIGP